MIIPRTNRVGRRTNHVVAYDDEYANSPWSNHPEEYPDREWRPPTNPVARPPRFFATPPVVIKRVN